MEVEGTKGPRVFSITGVHGSGKTTVYNSLRNIYGDKRNWIFMPERTGRPPYSFGSKDPEVAFRAELWYFNQMLRRNELIRSYNENELTIVCDRSPICVLAYSYALCSSEDFKTIRNLYSAVDWHENVVFYLEMNLESAEKRLTSGRRRNLEKWNEKDRVYILKVLDGYERAFKEIRQTKSLDLIRIPNGNVSPKETIHRMNMEILAP